MTHDVGPSPVPSRFERDTAVTPLGGGRYGAEIDPGWWIVAGPNGGYLGAIVGRAVEAEAEAASADRRLHSLTVHYLRPPAEGPVEVEAKVERSGRTVTTVTARMSQRGRLIALGTAAVATAREAPVFSESPAPDVPRPEDLPAPVRSGPSIEMSARYDMRPCIGSALAASSEAGPAPAPAPAVNGGWIRFAEPTAMDAVSLGALTDAWWPPVFHRFPGAAMAVPTVDLTVHVLAVPADPLDWVLARFASPEASGGYLVEDGRLWDRDGNLLAVSRQLAVFA